MADSRHITRRSAIVGIGLSVAAAATTAVASPASDIVQLGAELDAALELNNAAAVEARPYWRAWSRATSGIVGMPELAQASPAYPPYAQRAEKWNEASAAAYEVAERVASLRPATMQELAIVLKAEAFLSCCECLDDLFFESAEYSLAQVAAKAAIGAHV